MIVIAGKTCSGKTTIVNELLKFGFHKLVTTTTRPMRPGERKDIDYHFISKEEFEQKIEEDFFTEYKVYHTKDGDWYYGSAAKDIKSADNNTVAILTPAGIRDVKKNIHKNIFVIYIFVNNQTIKSRLSKRGDSVKEARRRMSTDAIDFRKFELESDKIIYNNDGSNKDDVVDRVNHLINRWRVNE